MNDPGSGPDPLNMTNEMTGTLPVRVARRVLETVTVARPRCPKCGGPRLRKYRSVRDQGDCLSLWWVRCEGASCGHHFRVLLQ